MHFILYYNMVIPDQDQFFIYQQLNFITLLLQIDTQKFYLEGRFKMYQFNYEKIGIWELLYVLLDIVGRMVTKLVI